MSGAMSGAGRPASKEVDLEVAVNSPAVRFVHDDLQTLVCAPTCLFACFCRQQFTR